MAAHVIVKEVFDLSFSSRLKNQDIQDEIDQMNKDKLLPWAERVFDEYDQKGLYHRFDKIQIDLGKISLDNFEDAFKVSFQDQMEQLFLTKKAGIKIVIGENAVKSSTKAIIARSKETIHFFLVSGRLPWWVSKNERRIDQKLEELITSAPIELIELLVEIWDVKTEKRLFNHMPNDLCQNLFVQVSRQYFSIQDIKANFEKHGVSGVLWNVEFAREVLDIIFTHLAQHGKTHIRSSTIFSAIARVASHQLLKEKKPAVSIVVSKVISLFEASSNQLNEVMTHLRDLEALSIDEIPSKNKTGLIASKTPKKNSVAGISPDYVKAEGKLTNDVESSTDHSITNDGPNLGNKDAQLLADQDEQFYRDKNEPLKAGKPEDAQVQKDDPKKKEEYLNEIKEQGMYVNNAGIVLLWPFLKNYFEELSLIKDKNFINEEAREKAVLLTQFLVTGSEDIPEYDLALNKILCGWLLDEPISQKLDLTLEAITGSESFIGKIAAMWKVIGEVSVSGFQQTFLQRDGLLKENDFGWQLIVERKTLDILLDKLPWSYNVIKLDWMTKPLFVEW